MRKARGSKADKLWIFNELTKEFEEIRPVVTFEDLPAGRGKMPVIHQIIMPANRLAKVMSIKKLRRT